MTVGEVCNREVVVAKPEAPLLEAVRLMKGRHVGDVVVVEEIEGQRVPTGILTDRDVALSMIDHHARLPYLRIADVMTRNPITAVEHENLYDVVKRMQSHGIRRLPVVNDEGGLEGILTFDDVIELLSGELTALAKLVVREQKQERLQNVRR